MNHLLEFKSQRLLAAVEIANPVPGAPEALALFTPSLPRVWELNLLLAPPRPDRECIERLLVSCEEIQGAAGLAHRKLRLAGSYGTEELATAAAGAAGWQLDRDLLMVHQRAPDRPPGTSTVQDVDSAAVKLAEDSFLSHEPHGRDPETRRQLADQYDRWEQAAPVCRRLGIVDEDRVVAWCRLFDDGRIAEIDDVCVLFERRGLGLGRELMEGAIAAAPPGRVLFLCADPDDWPRQLYERLGFEAVGERVGANRPPAEV
jgi:ribosomal protein S18 acetylase RimI-like enzyme